MRYRIYIGGEIKGEYDTREEAESVMANSKTKKHIEIKEITPLRVGLIFYKDTYLHGIIVKECRDMFFVKMIKPGSSEVLSPFSKIALENAFMNGYYTSKEEYLTYNEAKERFNVELGIVIHEFYEDTIIEN